ncbi:MAG: extracellular solute-binding protein, partial [Clostridiales bacterium]|nr:extracellular solute-binding protein [Clostridiales bacterium]
IRIYNSMHEQQDYETVWNLFRDSEGSSITLTAEVTKEFKDGLYAALYYAPSGKPTSNDKFLYDSTATDYDYLEPEGDPEDSNDIPGRYRYTFVFTDEDFENGLYYIVLAKDEASTGNPLAVTDIRYTKNNTPTPGPIDPDKLQVWSWNEEIMNELIRFSDVQYQYSTTPNTGGAYRVALDAALASGDGAPDVYGLEADFIQGFMNTGRAMPVSQLGIKDSELSDMFDYVLDLGSSSDGKVFALSWGANPGGVFYNRSVASKYLGVSTPNDVQTYYSSWNNFVEMSRTVKSGSDGQVRAVASIEDPARSYRAGKTKKWVTNGSVTFDSWTEAYLDFGKLLYDEELTFNASQWASEEWYNGPEKGNVLSYFGPMWLGQYSLGIVDFDGNVAKDEWGFVKAPTDFYWGGTWIAVSPYCKHTEDAAKMLRDLCLDQNNLTAQAKTMEFVNSKTVMNKMRTDSAWYCNWLGGQNPASKLIEIANGCGGIVLDEPDVENVFFGIANNYFTGEYKSINEAKTAFADELKRMNIT